MTAYIVARVIAIVPTVLLLLFAVVVLVRMIPGNAVDALAAEAAAAGGEISEADREPIEEMLGLNVPMWRAYLNYVTDAARGDLGTRIGRDNQPVMDELARRLPITLVLTAMSMVGAVVFGIAIGLLSAARQGSVMDYVGRSIAITGMSIPSFALATLIVIMPTIWWRWSPPVHYRPLSEAGPWSYLAQFIAPAAALGWSISAIVMRLTRTQLLEVLRQDYVRTARAKGLRQRALLLRHALPNALIPVVSQIGVQVAALLSGTVIIESIFGLPGIGSFLITAVANRDYPVLQGIAVITGLLVILTNLLVDISYSWIDPRVRVD